MERQDTGFLLNPNNIKLQREYFEQMCRTIGIFVIHRAPRPDKTYNGYGELDSFYYEPTRTGCIFDEHPTIWTMRKMGWNAGPLRMPLCEMEPAHEAQLEKALRNHGLIK